MLELDFWLKFSGTSKTSCLKKQIAKHLTWKCVNVMKFNFKRAPASFRFIIVRCHVYILSWFLGLFYLLKIFDMYAGVHARRRRCYRYIFRWARIFRVSLTISHSGFIKRDMCYSSNGFVGQTGEHPGSWCYFFLFICSKNLGLGTVLTQFSNKNCSLICLSN